jgi:hypothetical protein
VLLVVEPSAVAMGLAFFGPLMTQMVASMRQFDAAGWPPCAGSCSP